MPERIRLSRALGWRLPENAVHVARPSRWGNPFIVGKDGTRLQCAAKFAVLAGGFIGFGDSIEPGVQLKLWRRLKNSIDELAGKDLACWCALDGGACHADVLIYLANEGAPGPTWMTQPIDMPRVRLGMSAAHMIKMQRAAKKRTGG